MIDIVYPCSCLDNILIINLTDESTNYSRFSASEIFINSIKRQVDQINDFVKCNDIQQLRHSIFQPNDGISPEEFHSPENILFEGGLENFRQTFLSEIEFEFFYQQAATRVNRENTEYKRYMPDEIVEHVSRLVDERHPSQIVWITDNSGSILFDEIRIELGEAVDTLRDRYSIRNVLHINGSEEYIRDALIVLDDIGSGRLVKLEAL